MRVTANWRITFTCRDGVADVVELEDYHGT
jgi:plasmid maintenance system killer protein